MKGMDYSSSPGSTITQVARFPSRHARERRLTQLEAAFQLRPAMAHDLEFARNLTRDNMLRYYIEYDLLWLDEAFDQAWSGRENWIILRSDARLGFCSLSRDAKAVYIRELQVQEQYRGQGAGAWVIEAVVARTCELRRSAYEGVRHLADASCTRSRSNVGRSGTARAAETVRRGRTSSTRSQNIQR